MGQRRALKKLRKVARFPGERRADKEQTPCGAEAPGKPALGLVFSEGRAGRPRAAMPGDAVTIKQYGEVARLPGERRAKQLQREVPPYNL